MKKLNILSLLLIFLMSCSEDPNLFSDTNKDESPESLKYAGDGLYDLLGYGCDVTDDIYSGKARIIDNNALILALKPQKIDAILTDAGQLKYESLEGGTTATTYLRNLTKSKKINIGGSSKDSSYVGSGSLTKKFTDYEKFSKTQSFAHVDKLIRKRSYSYTIENNVLRRYLSGEFKQALQTLSNQFIIEKFGTHVYTNVVLGGKISILYRAEINSEESKKTKFVEAGASGTIKKVFNFDVKYTKEEQIEASKNTRTYHIYITAIGGNSSIPFTKQLLPSNEVDFDISTEDWEKSTDIATNTNLIDFAPGSLIPIWEFVESPSKKASLKKDVEQYIKSKQVEEVKEKITNILHPQETLFYDEALTSIDGRFRFTLQRDNNLVLYKNGVQALWSSKTNNIKGNCHLSYQGDGNIVLYLHMSGGGYKAVWSTNSMYKGAKGRLDLQNDGNLVLYDSDQRKVWSTNTWRN